MPLAWITCVWIHFSKKNFAAYRIPTVYSTIPNLIKDMNHSYSYTYVKSSRNLKHSIVSCQSAFSFLLLFYLQKKSHEFSNTEYKSSLEGLCPKMALCLIHWSPKSQNKSQFLREHICKFFPLMIIIIIIYLLASACQPSVWGWKDVENLKEVPPGDI